MPFSEFVELALYDAAGGFYATGGAAGRDGDFLTSPEVGPLFAAVLARALDTWWDALGRPDPYCVVEAGAGSGVLAADVVAAGPACSPALRYLLVERSEQLRREQAKRLAIEPSESVIGSVLHDIDEGRKVEAGQGPLAASLPDLPVGPLVGVVVANELLDNLPFDLLERRGRTWQEVRVDEDLREVLLPARPDLGSAADRLAPRATDGARIPIQRAAAAWVRSACRVLSAGRVVAFDYTDSTDALADRPWLDWVRTYCRGGRGTHPLDDPGSQDITCQVAVDQLPGPVAMTAQAEFLTTHGLDELADAARTAWREQAAIGDLEALKARSRVDEAAALTDPEGIGAFSALEWVVGPLSSRP